MINVPGAGHRIQDDKPDAVAEAVVGMAERLRKGDR
jgi:pimeloyl-ACP methyl ester carboxylesterase